MNPMRYLGVFLAACLSCTLSGCVAATPDEAEDEVAAEDESAAGDESAGTFEEGEEALAEETSELQSSPAGVVGCNGAGNNWCLATCSSTGDYLHVLGHRNQYDNICQAEGENFCQRKNLGYRTRSCWGHL